MNDNRNHDHNTERPDDAVARRAAALFDESVGSMDGETLSQLNQRRHAALEKAGQVSAGVPLTRWLAAGGATAAAVLAIALLNVQGPGPDPVRADAVADFELLLEQDEFEMLEELEFYSWIDLEPESADAGYAI